MDSQEVSLSNALVDDVRGQPSFSWSVCCELREFWRNAVDDFRAESPSWAGSPSWSRGNLRVSSSSSLYKHFNPSEFKILVLFHRTVFYIKNKDAEKTNASAKNLLDKATTSKKCTNVSTGWSSDASKLPVVTVAAVVGYLMQTGKNVSTLGDESVVQKPLRRGHDLFMKARLCSWRRDTRRCNNRISASKRVIYPESRSPIAHLAAFSSVHVVKSNV